MKKDNGEYVIEVVNLEKYQTRKDIKKMKWFRVDTDIFEHPQFYRLTSTAQRLWFFILSRAARHTDAKVELNRSQTCAILKLNGRWFDPSLMELEENHWVKIVLRPEKRSKVKESKVKRSKEKLSKGKGSAAEPQAAPSLVLTNPQPTSPKKPKPYEQIFILYNQHRGELPPAKALNKTRREKMEARWREVPDPAYWGEIFSKAGESSFLTGKNDRGWKANLDWLIKNDTNHAKVGEGAYERGQGRTFTNEGTMEALKNKWRKEDERNQTC